jgi:hypothetical protein
MRLFLTFCVAIVVMGFSASAQSLDSLIRSGALEIVRVVGNGNSSGASLDGVLQNNTSREVEVDIHLVQPVYFQNGGRGQNMIATQVYGEGGSYYTLGNRSFITIPPNGIASVMFIAYCADFERDNPSSSERFVHGEMPSQLREVAQRIAAFEAANPTIETTVASQVALWLAAGLTPATITSQFAYTQRDLDLARRILR